MKTNKSFTKRLKITKNGKVLSRGKGRNHFRAKKGRRGMLAKNRNIELMMTNREKRRFL